MLYANRIYWLHWNHSTKCKWPCYFWTISKRTWTIKVEGRHGRLRTMVNLGDGLQHTRLISVNPTIQLRSLLIQRRSRALKSQFISSWDLHYGIGQHHCKWSRTVSIDSSLGGYPGPGRITLNNGIERMKKWNFERDMHDNVTWATKLILMMRYGFQINSIILAIRWLLI